MNKLWLYRFISYVAGCHAPVTVSQRLGWKILWYIQNNALQAGDAWLEGFSVNYIKP